MLLNLILGVAFLVVGVLLMFVGGVFGILVGIIAILMGLVLLLRGYRSRDVDRLTRRTHVPCRGGGPALPPRPVLSAQEQNPLARIPIARKSEVRG